jgi:hypothetical protein
VALDVAADVHGEVLEQGLLVDAARGHPLVLVVVVPPDALLQRLGICRWCIHRSMSVRFVRHSSSRTIVAWR